MKLGDEVLLFGAGPVGLILLQLLKHHGASTLVVCAPTEHKLRIAEQLGATEVVKLNKADYSVHASELKQIAPHGYDIVVDATGSPEVLEHAFEFLKCDSVLHVFGVYPKDSKICIRPYDIFKNDIRIIGTFAQLYTFTSALRILENNLIDVKPLVSHKLPLDKFGEALELMRRSHERLKILIKP
jgi:D-arabinitol dehydrogenase (NADP+)